MKKVALVVLKRMVVMHDNHALGFFVIAIDDQVAAGETMTSYMVLFPNGGKGGAGVFPETCGNLPFGSRDLFVKGELGER